MLLAARVRRCAARWRNYVEGYEQFRPFDRAELGLLEPLRPLSSCTIRMARGSLARSRVPARLSVFW